MNINWIDEVSSSSFKMTFHYNDTCSLIYKDTQLQTNKTLLVYETVEKQMNMNNLVKYINT